jgi:raffinose/stachyose/melibiose transport system substrate-binding protein
MQVSTMPRRGRRALGAGIAGIAGLALVLSGCAGGAGGADDTLVVAVPKQEVGENPYQSLVDGFSEANPDVSIELREFPVEGFSSVLRTQLQGGDAPDIVFANPGSGSSRSVLSLAEAGFLQPLTGTGAEELVSPSDERFFWAEDELWAQPTVVIPTGIVFNRSAMEADGVEWPDTFDGVLEVCEQAADAGKSMFVMAGGVPDGNNDVAVVLAAYQVYADDPDWNDQRDADEVDFATSPGWNDVLDTYMRMRDARCFQDGVEGAGFDTITNRLSQGESYAAFIPAGAAGDLMNANPGSVFDVDVLPSPVDDSRMLLASADGGFAVTTSANRELAQQFLDWVAQPDVLAEFALTQNGLPIGGEGEVLPQYEPVADLIESGAVSDNRTQEWGNEVYLALSTGIQGMFTGQATKDVVLTQMDGLWGR